MYSLMMRDINSEDPGFSKGEEKRFDAIIRMAEGSAYKAGAFIDKIKKDQNFISRCST